tara:strand:+ start:204 stop:521 length:318 start_codon:yes stop_codon:yes gene_type:complete
MLSLSVETTGQTIGVDGLTNPSFTKMDGTQHSEVLIRFINAVMNDDGSVLARARETLVSEIGVEAMVDVVGVASNFQRMVRIADGTGIPPTNLGMDAPTEELNEK